MEHATACWCGTLHPHLHAWSPFHRCWQNGAHRPERGQQAGESAERPRRFVNRFRGRSGAGSVPAHGLAPQNLSSRAGTEFKVTTERPALSLSVSELNAGSWVIFELPGFTTAASGTAQDSLDALRKATATSYYKGNGSLWVKLVSTGDVLGTQAAPASGGTNLQVSR
jgi:hypothetical protein